MRRLKHLGLFLILVMTATAAAAQQQMTGVVTDAETGDSIGFASVVYRGHGVSTAANAAGVYSIGRHAGWSLTFSAVGYKSRHVRINEKTGKRLDISLKPDKRQLAEVTVKARKNRYSRKDNPAVELMRRVVAAKKKTDIAVNDYYQYSKYEKTTLAYNDLRPEQLEQKPFSNHPWLLDQIEMSTFTGKMILPLSVEETVSQKVYRRAPHAEKTIIQGQRSTGVNDLFQTGDIINTVVKDIFTDVDIYENHIRLLQRPFVSPVSQEGIGFYRYYIEDTLLVDRDRCIHLHFLPNNQHDMGFRGDLYILDDSTLHIRRCQLTVPKQSTVSFVDNMQVLQEYEKLPDGQWVLTKNDMVTELKLYDFIKETAIVTRTTRLMDYSFEPLPDKLFKGMKKEVTNADAQMRGDDFWKQYRQVELSKSEQRMDKFIDNMGNIKGFKYIIYGLKTLFENSMETGSPNYVDICPVNTVLSRNYVDGWRSRLSAKTTANLNRHLFLAGYYARGWGSHKNYYSAEATYSLNPKNYLPHEFPRRTLTVQSCRDVCSPGDRFMETDKDNFLVAFKWAKVDKMMFYDRQLVTFDYETDWGLKATVSGKREENEACGAMSFQTMDKPHQELNLRTGNGEYLRTTEVTARLRYAPGETYINNKLRRRVINLDAPVFNIAHTRGFDGVLGGDYDYNYTEAHIFKRFWLGSSWGKIDADLKGGIQWNQVPYPLLIHPAGNQSYIILPQTFSLINTMEFLSDRFASLMLSWDMNGKLLNRLPVVRDWNWREYLGVRMLWGSLSDKNNPLLPENAGNPQLMYFPDGVSVMNPDKPYVELVVGLHKLFKFFNVDYVRRLNYNELPTSKKWGVRFSMTLSF
ncbi:MAG: carboxypeptidase-like regulatory domain-containing protein [Prevotella sp.]|nr:carboxypeptidase-like regulatory domain-containing protein [Prevotella sp.]